MSSKFILCTTSSGLFRTRPGPLVPLLKEWLGAPTLTEPWTECVRWRGAHCDESVQRDACCRPRSSTPTSAAQHTQKPAAAHAKEVCSSAHACDSARLPEHCPNATRRPLPWCLQAHCRTPLCCDGVVSDASIARHATPVRMGGRNVVGENMMRTRQAVLAIGQLLHLQHVKMRMYKCACTEVHTYTDIRLYIREIRKPLHQSRTRMHVYACTHTLIEAYRPCHRPTAASGR